MSMLCWSGELEICLICVLIEIIEKIERDANPVAMAVYQKDANYSSSLVLQRLSRAYDHLFLP